MSEALPLPTSPLHPEAPPWGQTASERQQEFSPLHLPTSPCPIIMGWVVGSQSSDHWSLRAHSSPQMGNRAKALLGQIVRKPLAISHVRLT